jgi:hypothetical protein
MGKFRATDNDTYSCLQLTTEIFIDVLISTSIAWALFRHKTGWKATDNTVTRLIWVSLETQIPGLVARVPPKPSIHDADDRRSILILGTWGLRAVGPIFL